MNMYLGNIVLHILVHIVLDVHIHVVAVDSRNRRL